MDDLIRYVQKKVHEQRREVQRLIGKRGEKALFAVVIAEFAAKIATWVSLSRRSRNQVRGPKWAWRAASLLNGVGPAGYWLFGRK